MSKQEWPLYEVFIRSKSGLSHRHAGSVHAADDQMALDNARDTYTRRSEGVSLWVVRSISLLPRIRPIRRRSSSRLRTKFTVIQRFMRFRMGWTTYEPGFNAYCVYAATGG